MENLENIKKEIQQIVNQMSISEIKERIKKDSIKEYKK